MHELAIVEQLVAKLIKARGKDSKAPVRVVRLRHGPGLTQESVTQAFLVQSKGTPLAQARLEVISQVGEVPCDCGAANAFHAEELDSPYVICQDCLRVLAVPGFNRLEVLDVE